MNVSGATSPRAASRRVSRGTRGAVHAALAILTLLAVTAAACSSPPKPRGWTGARPVMVDDPQVVLAAYKKELFAIRPQESQLPVWQFPPANRDTYLVSEASRDEFTALIEETGADDLLPLVDELTVRGDNVDTIKDQIDLAPIDDEQKDLLKTFVDETTKREDGALSDVDALYGDIGVSDDGLTAFVPGYGGWLYALDVETGDMRWLVDLGDEIVGGVAVDGISLYLGTKAETLYALSADDGDETWRFAADGEIWATPAVDGDGIYFTTLSGSVYRVDADGNETWRFNGADSGIGMRPTVVDGVVYAGSFDQRAYALNADDGSQKWEFETDDWLWSAPIIEADTVFFAALDGKVYALNVDDGSARWEQPFDANAEVRAALARGAGGIVVAGRDGLVHQVDMETGEALDEPFQAGENVEADLTTDSDSNVYAVPLNPAVLYVIDTSGQLSAVFFSLPQ